MGNFVELARAAVKEITQGMLVVVSDSGQSRANSSKRSWPF
jgi:hypothetical protein